MEFIDIIVCEDIREMSLEEATKILIERNELDSIDSCSQMKKRFGYRSTIAQLVTWEQDFVYRNFNFTLRIVRKFVVSFEGNSIKISQRKTSSKYWDYFLEYEPVFEEKWGILDTVIDKMVGMDKFNLLRDNTIYGNFWNELQAPEDNYTNLKPHYDKMLYNITSRIDLIQDTAMEEIERQKRILDIQEKFFAEVRD